MGPRAWEWDQEPGNETKSLGMGPRAWEWDQELGNGTKILGMRLNGRTLWVIV